MPPTTIQCRRVYDQPSVHDGMRVLVDRLWPRGLRKEDIRLDEWAKDLAPSSALRRTFHDDAITFEAFTSRYRAELDDRTAELDALLNAADDRTLTLLYASKNTQQNHARVLRDVLLERC